MAIGFGIFLSLFVYFAVTTCSKLQWPLLSTQIVEKNEEALLIHVTAEELQLEIQSRTYSADWSSLERIAQFLKAEYEGRTKEKLLATSAYIDDLRSVVKSGSLNRKIKLVSPHWRVKFKQGWLKVMLRVKLLMVLFV